MFHVKQEADMKNFVQDGTVIAITAPAAVKSGDFLVVGSLAGVCAADGNTGDIIQLQVEGVFALPKAAVALAQGQRAYWHVANKNVVAAAGAGICSIGAVTEAAGSTAPTCRVRLDESATTVG
jgi:predicted RecA/RadA family phage recombinase